NTTATVLLIAGLIFIKKGHKRQHIVCMVSALVVSAAFLTSYLIYHYNYPTTRFAHDGLPKLIYFIVLFTHIPLAMVNLPMIIMTVVPALRKRFDRHKRIARWTYPIWLYVSVTGVIVYMMLYRWFPAT
ncbi:MAG: DUF420 domain-containing protein, partial [Verrucomicrobiales bacterium]